METEKEWVVVNETENYTMFERKKKFSILMLILFSVFYVVYYLVKGNETKTIKK